MAVDHVKATEITNRDAIPPTRESTGEGSPGALIVDQGYSTAVASSSADATYQLVRVRSNVKVKELHFESEAQTAGKFDIGVYYASDGSKDGVPTALLAADAIDQDFFATVIDCASAVARTDILNESGTNTLDKRDMPLWEALGLTADPNCNFDIVATVKTTAVTTGTGKFGISIGYVT